jgi:WD40 repeat protein
VLCALTVGIVYGASNWARLLGITPAAIAAQNQNDGAPNDNLNKGGGRPDGAAGAGGDGNDQRITLDIRDAQGQTALDFTAFTGGHVQSIYRQEVPAEKEGKLLYLATEIKDLKKAEFIPSDKKFRTASYVMAYRTDAPETVPADDRVIVEDNKEKNAIYRKMREGDEYVPSRVALGYVWKWYRKLSEGDAVKAGDLVAQVDTVLARDEVKNKIAKLDVAQAEIETSTKTKQEAKKRYERMVHANELRPGSFAQEDVDGGLLTWQRYEQEEIAKKAALVQAQRELSAAVSILNKHEIRADRSGVIKVIYKRENEAVKNLDPVLQIQDPEYLRVEVLVDVQDINRVKEHMPVTVEPTVIEPPLRTLRGHLLEVHAVAVGKYKKDGKDEYVVVSASEDKTARGWDWRTGRELWKLNYPAALRSAACTGKDAEANLLLLGGADGGAILVDLDNLKGAAPLRLSARHQGGVLAVAFSKDGKTCATGGEDRAINLYDAATGKLLQRVSAAHTAAVTSLQFASDDRLVSAGRDGRLIFWDVTPGQPPRVVGGYDRRGGEVAQLGVSPDGKQVLFDQGKELRVMSTEGGRIEGLLQNHGAAANFSTMALFAPDGKTILTNTAGEGRVQLWRKPTEDGRAGELRQFLGASAVTTCGAFAPDSSFAVTGTRDHDVLLWKMPSDAEINTRVTGHVSMIDNALDAGSSRQVRVWVDVDNASMKGARLIPGSTATIVLPPAKE